MIKARRWLKFILPVSSLILILTLAQPSQAALVSCGRTGADATAAEQRPCTICDIVVFAKDIIDFASFKAAPAVATLLFLWAGFLMILGGATPGTIAKGKDIFTKTAIGLLIMYSAWLIANTFLRSFAGDANIATQWYKIECTETVKVRTGGVLPTPTPSAGIPTPTPTPRPGTVAAIAQRLLTNADVFLSTNASCGNDYHARQNITDIAAGKLPAVCSDKCISCRVGGTTGTININPRLLEGLESLASRMKTQAGVKITITSLTTGDHSPNSSHYSGEAADIIIGSQKTSDWKAARTYLNGLGGSAICEKKTDGSNDPDCDLSRVNHIHWTLRK